MSKTTIKTPRIVQIINGEYDVANGQCIYGLGEDNQIYAWQHWNGKWSSYRKKTVEEQMQEMDINDEEV